MNLNALGSKMKYFGDDNATLAKAIGISAQRLSAKKNETGGAQFVQREIEAIKNRYGLTPAEVDEIFFT